MAKKKDDLPKNLGGRPREHDRDQIALDLIEWAKKPDSINLCAFCCSREPPLSPSKIGDWARECSKFRGSYETAKAFLGMRREQLLNQEALHVKAYDLNAETYDYFLRDEKRNKAQFEQSLAKDTASTATEQQVSQFTSLMDILAKAQAQASERKIDPSKIISEQ